MSSLIKKECIENLKCLGVFGSLSWPGATGKLAALEFSFDVPNYSAFPVILYHLFENISQHECRKRFRDCWPLSTKADRVKFRHISQAWLHDIKRAEPPGTIPDFSSFQFDMPFGDRYVKFLYGLSTYAVRKKCQRRETGTVAKSRKDSSSSTCTDSVTSVTSSSSSSANKKAFLLCSSLSTEAQAMEKLRTDAKSDLRSFTEALLKEEELEQQVHDVLCEKIIKFAPRLNEDLDSLHSGLSRENLLLLVAKVIQRAAEKMREYSMIWEDLKSLVECRKAFDASFKIAMEERPTIDGIEFDRRISAPASAKVIFLRDGRLDYLQLVKALQTAMQTIRDNLDNMDDLVAIAALNESSRNSLEVLTLLVQEQTALMDLLKSMQSSISRSTENVRNELAELRKNDPSTNPPAWLQLPPVYNLKPLNFSMEHCRKPSPDWGKICRPIDDIPADTTANGTTVGGFGDVSEIKTKPDVTISKHWCDQTAVTSPSGESDKLVSTSVWTSTSTLRPDTSIFKQPSPIRKFRLSLSPMSSFSSFGVSSLSMGIDAGSSRRTGNWGESDTPTTSFSACSMDSPNSECMLLSRRFSTRLQGDLLKIFEDDEDEQDDIGPISATTIGK